VNVLMLHNWNLIINLEFRIGSTSCVGDVMFEQKYCAHCFIILQHIT
jgi:hypothetical protein